jgi:NTE family protein
MAGGAVRGAAQIGALEVFEEHGIHFDVVAGTSAGSVVGAVYAAGLPPQRLMDRLADASFLDIAEASGLQSLGLFHTEPLARIIGDLLGNATFADLPRKLIVVACDIRSGERVLITDGDVATAVKASTAVPGLFQPVEIGDNLLSDGGLVDKYPTSVPHQFGADAVVGIDIGGHPSHTEPSNVVEVLISAADIRKTLTGASLADVDIVPDVREFDAFEFEAIPEMHRRGRVAAEEALPAVADLLDPR